MAGIGVTRENIAAAVQHLTAMVLLLLLLQGRPVTAAVRRTDTERVLAVRQANTAIAHKSSQGVAVEVVESLRRELDTLELQRRLSTQVQTTQHTQETHLNKAHGTVALLAEAQLAVSRLLAEQLPQAVLKIGQGIPARRRRRG